MGSLYLKTKTREKYHTIYLMKIFMLLLRIMVHSYLINKLDVTNLDNLLKGIKEWRRWWEKSNKKRTNEFGKCFT